MKDFDEKLFLDLCDRYEIEVIEGKGKNVLIEDGIEKEITPESLLDTLTQRHNNLEKEPVVSKKDKTIVLSIQRDNDFVPLLREGVKKFRLLCSGGSDFFKKLQEPNTDIIIENFCKAIYKENHKTEAITSSTLKYIKVDIEIENRSAEEHKAFYNGWNNNEVLLVYVKEGALHIDEF